MYGLVNRALQGLITNKHGQEVWDRIIEQSGAPRRFLSMESYADEITYGLVQAASTIIETDAQDLLRSLGHYWVTYTAQEGYGSMFEMWGSDMRTFLENLDLMHSRVKTTMPALEPPMFTTETEADGKVRLTYRTHRDGLAAMVIGLLEGLGQKYDEHVEIEHVIHRASMGHDEFLLTFVDD